MNHKTISLEPLACGRINLDITYKYTDTIGQKASDLTYKMIGHAACFREFHAAPYNPRALALCNLTTALLLESPKQRQEVYKRLNIQDDQEALQICIHLSLTLHNETNPYQSSKTHQLVIAIYDHKEMPPDIRQFLDKLEEVLKVKIILKERQNSIAPFNRELNETFKTFTNSTFDPFSFVHPLDGDPLVAITVFHCLEDIWKEAGKSIGTMPFKTFFPHQDIEAHKAMIFSGDYVSSQLVKLRLNGIDCTVFRLPYKGSKHYRLFIKPTGKHPKMSRMLISKLHHCLQEPGAIDKIFKARSLIIGRFEKVIIPQINVQYGVYSSQFNPLMGQSDDGRDGHTLLGYPYKRRRPIETVVTTNLEVTPFGTRSVGATTNNDAPRCASEPESYMQPHIQVDVSGSENGGWVVREIVTYTGIIVEDEKAAAHIDDELSVTLSDLAPEHPCQILYETFDLDYDPDRFENVQAGPGFIRFYDKQTRLKRSFVLPNEIKGWLQLISTQAGTYLFDPQNPKGSILLETERTPITRPCFPVVKGTLEPLLVVNDHALRYKPGNYGGVKYFLGVEIEDGTLYYPRTQVIGQDYGISNRSLSLSNEGPRTLIYKEAGTGKYCIAVSTKGDVVRLGQTPQEYTIPKEFLFTKDNQLMLVEFKNELYEIIAEDSEWEPGKVVHVYGYTKKSRELILCIGEKVVLAKPADLGNQGPELGVVKRSGLVTRRMKLKQYSAMVNREANMSVYYRSTDRDPVQFFVKYQSEVYCCDLGKCGVKEESIKRLTVLSDSVIVEEKNGGWKAVKLTQDVSPAVQNWILGFQDKPVGSAHNADMQQRE